MHVCLTSQHICMLLSIQACNCSVNVCVCVCPFAVRANISQVKDYKEK